MSLLDTLSVELFEKIVLHLADPQDVPLPTEEAGQPDCAQICRLAQTCSKLNAFINDIDDPHVWRSSFLQRFDDLRCCIAFDGVQPEWKSMLLARDRAGRALSSVDQGIDYTEPLKLYLSILQDAPPGFCVDSKNVACLHSLLSGRAAPTLSKCSERMRALCRLEDLSATQTARVQAMLSTYIGTGNALRMRASNKERAGARAFCYSLRNWKAGNQWGPFAEDSAIDWCRMEVLMLITCSNALDSLRKAGVLRQTRLPFRLSAARPYSAPGWDSHDIEGDWAGVTGRWRRCISFLDWNDLQRYQGAVASGVGADYFARFAGPDGFTGEAVRILSMQLRAVSLKPGPILDRPTIIFEGEQVGAIESRIYGKVQMKTNGDIKWTLVSRYNGQDRWFSVGAQVGGVRSEYGVLGLWSGVDHAFDMGDPAGPFAMWRVSEDEPEPQELFTDISADDSSGTESGSWTGS